MYLFFLWAATFDSFILEESMHIPHRITNSEGKVVFADPNNIERVFDKKNTIIELTPNLKEKLKKSGKSIRDLSFWKENSKLLYFADTPAVAAYYAEVLINGKLELVSIYYLLNLKPTNLIEAVSSEIKKRSEDDKKEESREDVKNKENGGSYLERRKDLYPAYSLLDSYPGGKISDSKPIPESEPNFESETVLSKMHSYLTNIFFGKASDMPILKSYTIVNGKPTLDYQNITLMPEDKIIVDNIDEFNNDKNIYDGNSYLPVTIKGKRYLISYQEYLDYKLNERTEFRKLNTANIFDESDPSYLVDIKNLSVGIVNDRAAIVFKVPDGRILPFEEYFKRGKIQLNDKINFEATEFATSDNLGNALDIELVQGSITIDPSRIVVLDHFNSSKGMNRPVKDLFYPVIKFDDETGGIQRKFILLSELANANKNKGLNDILDGHRIMISDGCETPLVAVADGKATLLDVSSETNIFLPAVASTKMETFTMGDRTVSKPLTEIIIEIDGENKLVWANLDESNSCVLNSPLMDDSKKCEDIKSKDISIIDPKNDPISELGRDVASINDAITKKYPKVFKESSLKSNFEKTCCDGNTKNCYQNFITKLEAMCQKEGVPLSLAISVMTTESTGRCNAKSKEGSYGLFQIHRNTHAFKGDDWKDPLLSAKYGLQILKGKYKTVNKKNPNVPPKKWKQMESLEKGKWRRALSAYNGGQGHVFNMDYLLAAHNEQLGTNLDKNRWEDLNNFLNHRKWLNILDFSKIKRSTKKYRSEKNATINERYVEKITKNGGLADSFE